MRGIWNINKMNYKMKRQFIIDIRERWGEREGKRERERLRQKD